MKQLSLVALLVLFSAPAMAYVGPGLGMGVIGTIFGVLAAIVLAVFGLLWYPLKRRFGKKKADSAAYQTRSVITDKDATVPPGTTVGTRPDSPADTLATGHAARQTIHHVTGPSVPPDSAPAKAPDLAPDTATTESIDNRVR